MERKKVEKSEKAERAERAERTERNQQDRERRQVKFQIAKGTSIDYKQFNVIQKYVSGRGKIFSRRVTGVSAKQQREIVRAIKKARFLGVLSGSAYAPHTQGSRA
ncbi:MAG: 30S ribosomal protein S18 [Candidatus Omnitrophota bacterium]